MSERLATRYLGLQLDNPFVPSSSPLTLHIDQAKQLEDAGASALVLHSLFEEEIKYQHDQFNQFIHHQDIGHHEAETFLPVPDNVKDVLDNYLEQIIHLKQRLGIPIIASLNGISIDGWLDYGKEIEQAGADALELNIFYIAANLDETAKQVEQRYLDVVSRMMQTVNLPITVKLSPQHSAPVNFIHQLKMQGATGVSLFNRFYLPDINLETLCVEPKLQLSTSYESLLRIRWIAIISSQVDINIAATGGIHSANDCAKMLLAGADITHLCSVLLDNSPNIISKIREELLTWMDGKEYASIDELKGSLSQKYSIEPADFERANYVNVLKAFSTMQ